MEANGVRTTVVVGADDARRRAAIAGHEPVRHYAPSPDELEGIGVITSGFPVPGAPPEASHRTAADWTPDLT